MTEKPEHPNLVSGLVAKRNEIAREIAYHQERWRQLSTDLISIDGTIQIIAPDHEALTGKPIAHFVPAAASGVQGRDCAARGAGVPGERRQAPQHA